MRIGWFGTVMIDNFIYLTDKVDELKKNTCPLGVIPIIALKIGV